MLLQRKYLLPEFLSCKKNWHPQDLRLFQNFVRELFIIENSKERNNVMKFKYDHETPRDSPMSASIIVVLYQHHSHLLVMTTRPYYFIHVNEFFYLRIITVTIYNFQFFNLNRTNNGRTSLDFQYEKCQLCNFDSISFFEIVREKTYNTFWTSIESLPDT